MSEENFEITMIKESEGVPYGIDYNDWEALKPITCAFTGHRPQHLSFGFNEDHEDCIYIKNKLKEEIEIAINDGYEIFVSGGALGVDTWAAKAVLELQEAYPYIRLEIAIPCTEQEIKWTKKSKAVYYDILEKAQAIIRTSSRSYFKGCMDLRNDFLIRRSSRLIAVFNGKNGGTHQTILKAQLQGIDTKLIEI